MQRSKVRTLTFLLAFAMGAPIHAFGQSAIVVVAHPDTPALTEDALQKIYLGKVVEVDGRTIIPVNLARGNAVRRRFMEQFLAQEDDKFIAYWTVRRYIGKGSPPREFATPEEQLEFVRATPGAVGYFENGSSIKPGLKPLFLKPLLLRPEISLIASSRTFHEFFRAPRQLNTGEFVASFE